MRAEAGSPLLAVAVFIITHLSCADNREEVGTCGSSPGMLVYITYGRHTRDSRAGEIQC